MINLIGLWLGGFMFGIACTVVTCHYPPADGGGTPPGIEKEFRDHSTTVPKNVPPPKRRKWSI